MSNRDGFEDFISKRKLCKKYGAKLTTDRYGNYNDVRVNGHWITWQYAIKNTLNDASKTLNKSFEHINELLKQ